MYSQSEMKIPEPAAPKVPETVLARDPGRAMQEMMDIIDNLHGIIDEETRALETSDTKTFLGLQEKKLIAAQAYHDGSVQVISRKDEFKQVRPVFKRQLADRQEAFHASMEKNMKKLRGMSRGLQRMSDLLMESAREQGQKMQTVSYSAGGRVNTGEAKAVSIGINESA